MKKVILTIVLVAVATAMAAGDEVKGKPAPKVKGMAGAESSITDASHLTQAVPEAHGSDQAVSYRMFLTVSERGADLMISNPTDQPGVIMLLARGGEAAREVHASIAPGESWSLRAHEPGWSLDEIAYIKSSRRLRLGIQYPGEAQPAVIYLYPRAAYFEVFSAGNEAAVTLNSGTRQIEFVAPGRRQMKKLEDGAALVTATRAISEGAVSGRGVFVTYRAK